MVLYRNTYNRLYTSYKWSNYFFLCIMDLVYRVCDLFIADNSEIKHGRIQERIKEDYMHLLNELFFIWTCSIVIITLHSMHAWTQYIAEGHKIDYMHLLNVLSHLFCKWAWSAIVVNPSIKKIMEALTRFIFHSEIINAS